MFRLILILLFLGIAVELHATSVEAQADLSVRSLDVLPTPQNLSVNSFGQWVIGWGTGAEGARQRLDNIQREDVAIIKQKGTSLDMVRAWQQYYEQEMQDNLDNPTARYRAKLMKRIAELW